MVLLVRSDQVSLCFLILLPEYMSLKEGEVYFEGKDILTITPHRLREQCAYALQESHMFSDSIENNLKLGLSRMILTKLH